MKPLFVEILHIRRLHFGAFSGIQRLIPYLDTRRVVANVRQVQDNDDDLPMTFPFRATRARSFLRRAVQRRGQQWYKLSDLAAEVSLSGPWLKGHIDILHYLDGEHTAQYLPALSRVLHRRGKAIATYHQPPSVLPQVVVPAVVKRLDHVTLVSTSQLDYFSAILPTTRLSVLLHGIDTEFFRPQPRPPSKDVLRCITVGSYLRDWNLLAEIAQLLKGRRDLEFHVVSASAPSLGDNITVHRSINDETLRDLYQNADLLLLPLLDGTANNALLEAMAMALPVIASDLPSIREYAPAAAALLVPRDPGAFVAGIESLMGDLDRRSSMGCAARARAESLSWPAVARAYEGLYERVA